MELSSDRDRPEVSGDEHWEAVVGRNPRFDGVLYYAVSSTGIYCRPSCPSRRPRREHVRFFFDPGTAERAGFRACKRCRPSGGEPRSSEAAVVQDVCRYIEKNLDSSLSLRELGAAVDTNPFQLQKLFKRVTGISPRQYVEARRLSAFRIELRVNRAGVTEALYEAGYGSSSRIYEKSSAQLGMTPAQYRKGASEIAIRYAIAPCPLGMLLLGATERGICAIRVGDSEKSLEQGLAQEFPRATVERDTKGLGQWTEDVLRRIKGGEGDPRLPLDIRVTAFQRRVYNELRRIPRGETRSYGEIARRLRMPRAARAVARACATNPVAIVIPCHRVVRGDGGLGGYRWGIRNKRKLLAAEAGD